MVVGRSGGGSVACSLVARHPAVVRHAVIYEPPLSAVVPDGAEVVADYRAMSTFGLEVVDGGFGEPVVLVQTALMAHELRPVPEQLPLRDGFRTILYHRRVRP